MSGSAWVTLATNDSYSLGALVLAHSLRQVGTAHQLAVLVTPGVSGVMREKLSAVFNVVREVNVLDSRDEANLRLLQRPDLGITFTKLHCWRLTQFNKCVFLDADTLVLQNADELFEREEFSAAPDVGWPDCFNSGVFVYCPSEDTYGKLIQFALEKGSFDGGDQGLLNLYFSDWAHKDISKHLPFIYNMCSTACYSYLPAYKQFGGNVKILHFIGNAKPWLQYFDTATREVHVPPNLQHLKGFVQHWWNIFCSLVHPTLSSEMAGLAGAFARLTLGVPRTAEQNMLEDHLRRQGWEVGNIDYMGRDSFDNIWSKICATLSDSAPSSAPVQAAPAAPAPAQAAGPSPAAAPAQPQQPVEASEIVSAPKEPPAKAAEVPIAAVLPSEAPKPVESCPKPVPPAEIKPAAESCPRPAPAAASSEIKPSEPESPKPAPPSPSDSSKTASKAPSEPPKESTVCQKPSTPSDIPQPAAVSPPTHAPKVPPQQLESEKSAVAAVAPPLSAPAPAQPQAPAPKSQQTPPSSPAPKAEAAPAPPKSQQTPPSSPAPKAEAAPAPPKSQQTPPSSPAPKAAPPKLPQTPKAEAAPAKSQKTPPSSPSPKTEAAAAPPLKSEQTPPSSPLPKSQPKAAAAAPAKEAAEAPKAAPVKKAASVESPPAEEAGAASGGQGPTPPPRKTGGAASTKKTGKGKK